MHGPRGHGERTGEGPPLGTSPGNVRVTSEARTEAEPLRGENRWPLESGENKGAKQKPQHVLEDGGERTPGLEGNYFHP